MEKGLTLVIPLYNKVNTIKATLDSVLNNHGEYPFKCIIVDDDFTDGSSEIAEEYDVNYPDIFQYIKVKHHGNKTPAYARNLGIKLAETVYIDFLDADDELCAGFIDRGCNFLDSHPEYTMYMNGNILHTKDDKGNDVYMDVYAHEGVFAAFEDVLATQLGDVHFSASIYKTELAKHVLFAPDVICEDTIFKMEYAYKYPPICIDNRTAETIIYHEPYSESSGWHKRCDNNQPWQLEMLKDFKRKSGCNKYDFWADKNNKIYYQRLD